MLSERFGERIVLAFGLAVAGCGYLVLAAAPGVAMIVVSLFLAGLGGAFHHAQSSSLITGAYQDFGLRAALGTYNAAGDIGKLALSGAFTLAIGMGFVWQRPVAGFGVIAIISAAVIVLMLRRIDVGGPPPADASADAKQERIGWGIQNQKGFVALGVIVFLDLAVQSGFLTFLAFLMTEKKMPAGLAAFAVVLTLAGGIFGKFVCGRLAERIGVRLSLLSVQLLTAAGILAIMLSPTLVAFLLLPFFGLVLQGSSSLTYGSVNDFVRKERASRAFGLVYSISSAAAIAGPVLFGIIGDSFGLASAMSAMAFVALLSVGLIAMLSPTPENLSAKE